MQIFKCPFSGKKFSSSNKLELFLEKNYHEQLNNLRNTVGYIIIDELENVIFKKIIKEKEWKIK